VGVFYKTPSLEGGLLGPLSVRVTIERGNSLLPLFLFNINHYYLYMVGFLFIFVVLLMGVYNVHQKLK
jgi:hypothetical protein